MGASSLRASIVGNHFPGSRSRPGGTQILHGPRGWPVQFRCGVERPIWVSKQFTSKEHQVGLAILNNSVRLSWLSDHAHRTGRNAGGATDLLSEWRLKARGNGNLRSRDQATGRYVDQIHPVLL